jgi:hypothetical protein
MFVYLDMAAMEERLFCSVLFCVYSPHCAPNAARYDTQAQVFVTSTWTVPVLRLTNQRLTAARSEPPQIELLSLHKAALAYGVQCFVAHCVAISYCQHLL